MGVIYIAQESGNPRVRYVGQTTKTLGERVKRHYSSRHGKFSPWIKSVGRDNVEFTRIAQCPDEYLDKLETHLISRCWARGEADLNIAPGGSSRVGPKGSDSPHTSLVEEQVLRIKLLLWRGNPTSVVARWFGTTPGIVSRINSGKGWTHVPWPDGERTPMRSAKLMSQKAQGRVKSKESREKHSNTLKDLWDSGGMSHRRNMKGSSNGSAKLTEDVVRNIKERLWNGEVARTIGDDVGVSETVILGISNDKSWVHVPWPTDRERKSVDPHSAGKKLARYPDDLVYQGSMLVLSKGISYAEAGRRVRCGEDTIFKCVTRRGYRWIELPEYRN